PARALPGRGAGSSAGSRRTPRDRPPWWRHARARRLPSRTHELVAWGSSVTSARSLGHRHAAVGYSLVPIRVASTNCSVESSMARPARPRAFRTYRLLGSIVALGGGGSFIS